MSCDNYKKIYKTLECNDIIAALDKITDIYSIYKQYTYVVCEKKYGDTLFKYLYTRFDITDLDMFEDTGYLAYAIRYDNYELIDYICDVYKIDTDQISYNGWYILSYACKNLHTLQYLNNKFKISANCTIACDIVHVIKDIIGYANLDVIIYLAYHVGHLDEADFEYANYFIYDCYANDGNLKALTFICNEYDIDSSFILNEIKCVEPSNMGCVEYLWKKYKIADQLFKNACECGYIELVKYMLEVDAITDIDNI